MHDLGVIDGRFAVEHAVGSGGMGSVYRAIDRTTGAPVAVKVLHDANPQLRVRFDREARMLATLTHPSVVRYIAHGTTGADLHYLVMEWIDGETLKTRLERQGLDAGQSVQLAAAVADALAEAHRHGVIHRDVKPSNLLFVGGDAARVKLIDFGVARATAETVRLTEAGASVGTPGYMAPEQVRSLADVDARADLFALGCVLYECLSGRRAFAGADSIEVWIKIVLAQPTSLRVLAPELPEALVALVEKLLAKEPADRPAAAAEVAAALRAVAQDQKLAGEPRRLIRDDELPTMAGGKPLTSTRSSVAGSDDQTRSEKQRSVFLVVATDSHSDARAGDGSAVTTAAGDRRRAEIGTELDALASRHGGRADFLAEGSVVITLEAGDSSAETACAAGECALALRSMLPSALIAVTSGSGPSGSPILEDVIARGLRLIEAAALEAVTGADPQHAHGVQLDEATARLLADVFHIVPTLTGYQLRSAA